MAGVYIPDIFSGWLAGARQANADNWQDLANYNNVLGGQLSNAFAMDTYDPAVRVQWNNAKNSDMNTIQNAAATDRALQNYQLAQQNNLPQLQVQAAVQQIDNQIAALQQQKAAILSGNGASGTAQAGTTGAPALSSPNAPAASSNPAAAAASGLSTQVGSANSSATIPARQTIYTVAGEAADVNK